MKDEEIDWALYHMLEDGKPTKITELCERSGFSPEIVSNSLTRLENNCLICVTGDCANLLSLSDMMMINELKYAPNFPVYMENGVIKIKPEKNEPQT